MYIIDFLGHTCWDTLVGLASYVPYLVVSVKKSYVSLTFCAKVEVMHIPFVGIFRAANYNWLNRGQVQGQYHAWHKNTCVKWTRLSTAE